MSQCDFTISEDSVATCRRCSFAYRTIETDPARIHRKCTKAGLGDWVARKLEAVGITKKRYAKWRGLKECGCDGRQEWLNDKGFQWSLKARKFLNRFSLD